MKVLISKLEMKLFRILNSGVIFHTMKTMHLNPPNKSTSLMFSLNSGNFYDLELAELMFSGLNFFNFQTNKKQNHKIYRKSWQLTVSFSVGFTVF